MPQSFILKKQKSAAWASQGAAQQEMLQLCGFRLPLLGKRNLENLIRVKLREVLSNFAACKSLDENSKLSLRILDENREEFLANASVVLENGAVLIEINFADRLVSVVLLVEAHESIDDSHCFFLQFCCFCGVVVVAIISKLLKFGNYFFRNDFKNNFFQLFSLFLVLFLGFSQKLGNISSEDNKKERKRHEERNNNKDNHV